MAGLIEGLPDAVALHCLARVPLFHHPMLQLVCKAWHSIFRSPELFQVRKTVGAQEDWLYVCTYAPEKIWQAYDPVYNTWTILPRLPSNIANLDGFGSVGYDGKLYVIGGTSDYVDIVTGDRECANATSECWVYDPVNRRWSSQASMGTPRSNFACFLYEGQIVVAGGLDSRRRPIFTTEVFNPEVGEWQAFAALKEGPYTISSGVVFEGKMRAIHKDRMAQVFNSAAQSWVLEECSWAGGPMAVVNGELYVVRHGVVSREHHCLGQRSSPLCQWPECLNRIAFGVAGLGPDLYVVGGIIKPRPSQDIAFLNEVDICTVGGGREDLFWRKGAPMPLSRGSVQGCTVLRL